LKRPPYLLREKTRHGKIVWYFRIDNGPRIRIRGDYGTKEFMANYHAALSGEARPSTQERIERATGSLAWLVRQYRESRAWTQLSAKTRESRDGFLRHIESVDFPYESVTKKDIKRSLEKRADKPSMAEQFLKTARGLFKWALEAELIEEDPTIGVKAPKYKTDGHHVWTEEEVAQFEARWPIGSRERLALAILLYTGLRLGDACRLGRRHVKDGEISIQTEKTQTWVYLPVRPELAEIIEATKTGNVTFVAKENGDPMTKGWFGHWFGRACSEAGVPGSAHGLRKAGATRLAEAGATLHELNSVFGWVGTSMASLYTAKSDRRRLAASGMAKLKTIKE
jgi:integrase